MMDPKTVLELLNSYVDDTGKIFTVEFVKRTNGEVRRLNCRMGVKKHLKGGGPAYDFGSKGLVPVFDMQKGEYRCFPLDAVNELVIDGVVYRG